MQTRSVRKTETTTRRTSTDFSVHGRPIRTKSRCRNQPMRNASNSTSCWRSERRTATSDSATKRRRTFPSRRFTSTIRSTTPDDRSCTFHKTSTSICCRMSRQRNASFRKNAFILTLVSKLTYESRVIG